MTTEQSTTQSMNEGADARKIKVFAPSRLTRVVRVTGWYCVLAGILFLLVGLLFGPVIARDTRPSGSDIPLANLDQALSSYAWWRNYYSYQLLLIGLPSAISLIACIGALVELLISRRSGSSQSHYKWTCKILLALALSASGVALYIFTPLIVDFFK